MRRIDRLLQAARRAAEGQGLHIVGFATYSPGKNAFTVSVSVWDGVKGHAPKRYSSEHETAEEAEAALRAFAAMYPEAECTFFIDDLTFPEEVC
ncbi:MAG: hypothetical protein ACI4ML_02940 [Aristaeellaceae bacterium]